MLLGPKPSANELQSLVDNEVPESLHLEYKESLPSADYQFDEFLKDITSFANTEGGQIIYGISEARDFNNKSTGSPKELSKLSQLSDFDIRKLVQSIQQNTIPRVIGTRFEPVDFQDGKCLVISVPKSLIGPHMVLRGKHRDFYLRQNSLSQLMSYDQIKSYFNATHALRERLVKQRDLRISEVVDGRLSSGFTIGPSFFIQLVPINVAADALQLDELRTTINEFIFPNRDRWKTRENLDGIFSSFDRHAYVQLYKHGMIERYDTIYLRRAEGNEDEISYHNRNLINGTKFSQALCYFVFKALEKLKDLKIAPPIVILLQLRKLKSLVLHPNPYEMMYVKYEEYAGFDRDILNFAEILIKDFDFSHQQLATELLEPIWSACDSSALADITKLSTQVTQYYLTQQSNLLTSLSVKR